MSGREPLLSVRGLQKHYPITKGVLRKEVGRVRAVDGVSFEVAAGETLGIVGESGCGKSTVATSLLRLEEPTDGEVVFDGEDITTYDRRQLKRFRRRAQMIFQDPTASFDPRMSIGESVAEPLVIHGITNRERRRGIVMNLLERVGLSADDIDRYPHEFSGGQKQRVALARALVVNPELIVADEPVSALDVSIQADILKLMDDVKEEFGLAVLFISHDMGVVREVCDRVAVMYLGEIVEVGPTEALFDDPQHPYTQALLSSIPTPDPHQRGQGVILTGDVPSPANPPSGCRFHTRCPQVIQPDGYTFEQAEWRAVMDVRQRIRNRDLDVDAVREFVSGGDEMVDVDDADVKAEIRSEFSVPERLSSNRAERVFDEALSAAIDGDFDSADERLREAFGTVCERDQPELQRVAAEREAACHLLDRDQTQAVETPSATD